MEINYLEKDSFVPYLLNVIYLLLILFSLPWLVWQAVRKGKYRRGYAAKFLGLVPRRESDKTCLWLHAVSVGEVNLLLPLVRLIKTERPDWQCVISTTTAAGMELARKKFPQLAVFYCPLDFTWATAAAMRRVRPDILVLAELELWPNLVRAARRHGARVAVINGRLSEHSFRGYRRIRPLYCRNFTADRSDSRAGRHLCPAISPARRPAGNRACYRFDEIRRGANRSCQPGHPATCASGRLYRR